MSEYALEPAAKRFERDWLHQNDDRKTRGFDLRSTERKNRDYADANDNLDPAWTDVPAVSVIPVITGTAQVGQTLTATNGTWSNSPSFAKKWLANGAVISGATGGTYQPVVGDIGKTITVEVTASKTDFPDAKATSQPTAAVIAA